MKILKLILLTFLVFNSATKAAVEVTSGKYVVNNSDLSIKVIGGFLVWEREYRDRQWYFNRPWESLKLNIDNVSGQLKSIQKANDTYTGVDSAGTLFKSGKRRIITKLQDNTFIWKDRDGHITKYDENGRTLSVATQAGAKINLIYNAEGKISGASDVLNNQILWISYDINTGMISSVKDYANIQVNYTWQEINANADLIRYKLIKVEDSNGKFWDYEYTTNPGRDGRVDLYKITDPKNNIETVNYSGPGIVNYVSDQNDYKKFYKFEYIKARKEYYLKITNADGLVSESWYESNGKLRRKSLNGIDLITVNEDLRKRIETDIYGRVTTREFDEFNNLLKIVYPNGATEEYTYDITNSNVKTYKNRNNILTRYEYDSSGNLIKQIDASGTNVERQILYSYDQYGQATSILMEVGENNQPLYKQLFYDNYGNVREEIDGRGHSATYTHNSQGKRITATSPLGYTWNYKYDNKSNLTEAKSPKQIITKFEYDEIGLFSKQINPDSSSNGYSYTQYGKVATRTSELGTKESREYNSFGQVSKLTDYSGNEITNSYDIIGRLIKTTFDDGKNIEYTYPQNGNYQNGFGNLFLPIKVQYPTFEVNLKYDSRNRVIQESKTYMLNSQEIEEVKNIKYDDMDNIIEITGDFVLDEKFEYDALNRITKTYVNNTLENQYYYDSRNLLTSFIDANGHKYEYEYDLNSNKVKEIKPMGQFESYTYDDDNHLLSKTDSNGNKIVYSYDIDGRLVKEEFFDSTQSKNKTVNYTLNDMGLIEQYDDGVSVGNYTYNLAKQLSTKSVTIDGKTFSHSYTYYNNGLKKTYTGVDGITYQFFYKNNRLENIVIPSEGNINYSDFEWERPQTVSYPGGITKKLSYNGSQNLKSIEVKDAENNIIQNQSYIYDDKGLLASKQTMQGIHQYQYDEKFRVIGATHPSLPAESWEYDNGGNRLKDNLSGLNDWIYNENNQLIDSHLNKFSYDNNGNMIEILDGNSNVLYGFKYNESKDVKYLVDQNNNNIFEYYYDPFGKRLYKKDLLTNEKTYYHYSEEGLTYEQDSLGNEINYLYEPHVNLNTEPVLKNVNGSYFYYLNGDLGTPNKIIDKTGVTHLALEYSAFGKTSKYMTVNNHNDNLRFPGQYFDEESGMNYNHSRYYNSKTGRYNQGDKLGVLADYHVYTYALNNPLSYVDPFGEFAVDLCLFYGIGCVSIEFRHEGNCINIYGCASIGVDIPPGCSRRGTCGSDNGPRKHRFPDFDLIDEPIDFPPKPKPKKGKRKCVQFPNDQPCSFFAGYSGVGITCRLKVCKLLDTTCKECFDCYE